MSRRWQNFLSNYDSEDGHNQSSWWSHLVSLSLTLKRFVNKKTGNYAHWTQCNVSHWKWFVFISRIIIWQEILTSHIHIYEVDQLHSGTRWCCLRVDSYLHLLNFFPMCNDDHFCWFSGLTFYQFTSYIFQFTFFLVSLLITLNRFHTLICISIVDLNARWQLIKRFRKCIRREPPKPKKLLILTNKVVVKVS